MSTTKMSPATKDQVLKALDGMHTIARAEMMQQVGYVEMDVKPRRAASVCQGHQACAIGSLWLAAGVRPKRLEFGSASLPGASPPERGAFIARRPVLRHALQFLNEAAAEYMEKNDIYGNKLLTRDTVESLFESDWFDFHADDAYTERRAAMLKVISAAKRKARAA